MGRLGQIVVIAMGAASMTGCYSNQVVPNPTGLTLTAAMKEVGQGLRKMHEAAHPTGANAKPFGLYASEVTITFNVTAQQTNSGTVNLVLDANAAPPALAVTAGGSLSVGGSTSNSASRGNTVVVKLQNPVFAAKDTLVHTSTTSATTQPIGEVSGLKRMLDDLQSSINPAAIRQN